ncbi:hypothetical protein [Streptomyces sp. CA-251251]|uniref:hypothetical protein n=1 Tax=Streptomyces sp. CA-251251 TaxID=3240063 RepID=UPI003D9408E2
MICTVTGPLARHVAECLTDAVHVIATGTVALRDNVLYLDSAQVGVDLAHHVAYIDETLPAVLAGRAPASAPRPTATPQAPTTHRARPSRPTPPVRPAPVPAAATDWWRSAPRTTWDTPTEPSHAAR